MVVPYVVLEIEVRKVRRLRLAENKIGGQEEIQIEEKKALPSV